MLKTDRCIDCKELKTIFGIKRCRNCYSKYKEDLAPKIKCQCSPDCNEIIPSHDESGNPRKLASNHRPKGANNTSWKGGSYIMSNGYRVVKVKDHPSNYRGYVLEHRLVMEKHLGRYLNKDELIDHINENKLDNRIENLRLITRSLHQNRHNPRKGYIKDVSGRTCFECNSDKTYMSYNGQPHWCRHPITKQEWLCEKCYKRIKRSISE